MVNTTRIDCFTLKLTCDYLAKLPIINNTIINDLGQINVAQAKYSGTKGYPRPQDFIYHDKNGIIQDEKGIPILYHWGRHKKNKKLPPDYNTIKSSKTVYPTTIPEIDQQDFSRLNDKYIWLTENAEHITKLRERKRKFKRHKKLKPKGLN